MTWPLLPPPSNHRSGSAASGYQDPAPEPALGPAVHQPLAVRLHRVRDLPDPLHVLPEPDPLLGDPAAGPHRDRELPADGRRPAVPEGRLQHALLHAAGGPDRGRRGDEPGDGDDRPVREVSAYRAIYYLPSILPVFAISFVFVVLLNPGYGLINWPLSSLGLPSPNWLGDPAFTKLALVMIAHLGAGQFALVFLAGLRGVPKELYKSAAIDGAGGWAKFRNITLPMMTRSSSMT